MVEAAEEAKDTAVEAAQPAVEAVEEAKDSVVEASQPAVAQAKEAASTASQPVQAAADTAKPTGEISRSGLLHMDAHVHVRTLKSRTRLACW